MTAQEAKNEAYPIWLAWEGRREKSKMLGLKFYVYLQNNHPHLITFPCSGDHYQVVNSWVAEWKRIDNV